MLLFDENAQSFFCLRWVIVRNEFEKIWAAVVGIVCLVDCTWCKSNKIDFDSGK